MNKLVPSPQIEARFEAWWTGELVNRPPVTLHVNPVRPSLITSGPNFSQQ